MRSKANIGDWLRAAFAGLLLVPFALTQFLAPGTMPKAGPGGIEVVICTDAGLQTVVIGPEGVPVEVPQGDGHQEICPWATAGQSFAVAAAPAVSTPERVWRKAEMGRLRALTEAAASAGLLPPARAPPASV